MTECERCRQLETHIAQQEETLTSLAAEREDLRLTVAGQEHIVQRVGREIVMAKNELRKAREEEPGSDDVKELFHLWREEHRGGKPLKFKVSGPRGQHIKKAIGWKGKEMCAEAILGWKHNAWAMTKKPPLDDITKQILKDEDSIEKWSAAYRENRRSHLALVPALPSELPDIRTVQAWQTELMAWEHLPRLLERHKWTKSVLFKLGVGFDPEANRLAFPVFDVNASESLLFNVVRYRHKPGGEPEFSLVPNRPERLWPDPVRGIEGDPVLWLVSDPAAAVSGHVLGVSAVAVPSEGEPFDQWSGVLRGCRLVVCLGTHERKRAVPLARQLSSVAGEVRVVDLDAKRTDRYGLTEWLVSGNSVRSLQELAAQASPIVNLRGREAA